MRRFGPALLAAVALAIVAPTGASAATLPASTAYNISTTKMQDGRVFWFQRNRTAEVYRFRYRGRTFSYRDWIPSRGEIFTRQFGSNKVDRIYRPAKPTRITAFEYGSGKLLVGLRSDLNEVTTTKIVQLIENNGKWTESVLVERSSTPTAGHCGESVELIDLRPDGQPLVEFTRTEGLNGACALTRRNYELKLGTDPATAGSLATRRTGWSTNSYELTLAAIAGDGKDWYALINDSDSYKNYRGVININDGRRIAFENEDEDISNVEFTSSGAMLVRIDEYGRRGEVQPRFSLRKDPSQPNVGVPLRRKGSTVWFRSCGDNLLEISRRKATKRRQSGSVWNLYLRDADGNVKRRFKERIPRRGTFGGCNAGVAVLNVPTRSKRVRQFVVDLSEAGPTGGTGATGATN